MIVYFFIMMLDIKREVELRVWSLYLTLVFLWRTSCYHTVLNAHCVHWFCSETGVRSWMILEMSSFYFHVRWCVFISGNTINSCLNKQTSHLLTFPDSPWVRINRVGCVLVKLAWLPWLQVVQPSDWSSLSTRPDTSSLSAGDQQPWLFSLFLLVLHQVVLVSFYFQWHQGFCSASKNEKEEKQYVNTLLFDTWPILQRCMKKNSINRWLCLPFITWKYLTLTYGAEAVINTHPVCVSAGNKGQLHTNHVCPAFFQPLWPVGQAAHSSPFQQHWFCICCQSVQHTHTHRYTHTHTCGNEWEHLTNIQYNLQHSTI